MDKMNKQLELIFSGGWVLVDEKFVEQPHQENKSQVLTRTCQARFQTQSPFNILRMVGQYFIFTATFIQCLKSIFDSIKGGMNYRNWIFI
jgi:hypothetical protein